MQIELNSIAKKVGEEKTYTVSPDIEAIGAAIGYPIRESEPFALKLTNIAGERLVCEGRTKVRLVMPCDRCLADVEKELTLRIERQYPIEDEVVVEDAEDPVSGIVDEALDTDILMEDEIRIGLPAKVLCRDDCKGLCPVCGADLNKGECGCERTVGSLQMASALDQILDEIKEV